MERRFDEPKRECACVDFAWIQRRKTREKELDASFLRNELVLVFLTYIAIW